MQTYEQVDNYMNKLGLKYYKNANDFFADLMRKTNKDYATDIASLLTQRAQGQNSDNVTFYELKNKLLEGSLCVSAAFDSGVFRHIGNMVIDNANAFTGTVLDIGCDCGIVSCFIAQQYPECKVIGVDRNELAINNAKELSNKLGLTNTEFIVGDIYDFTLEEKANTVTSFRCLLDVAQKQTKGVSVIGERSQRENEYQKAFSPLACAISNNLADGGVLISVERYTAMYGWLGWMQALAESGINPIEDECGLMQAKDISNTIDYSVTIATKQGASTPFSAYDKTMSKKFKSGAGCDGADAEYALYTDSEEIEFTDVYKGDKLIHQFATALSLNGKHIFYEADLDYRKIKYCNDKKSVKMQAEFENKLDMYDKNTFDFKKYTVKSK